MVRASLLRVGKSLQHVLTAAIGVLQNLLFGGKQKEYLAQCYGAMTLGITTRSITTFSITRLSLTVLTGTKLIAL